MARSSWIKNPIGQLKTIDIIFTFTFFITRNSCHRCVYPMVIVTITVVACTITFSLRFFRLASFLTLFRWLCTFCDHMIFRSASKAFPCWTIRIFVRWSTSRTSFLFSFLIFLRHFSTEWLESPQYVHFALEEFDFSLCLIDPDWLLSRFKYSVCKDEMFKHFWSGYFSSLLNSAWWLANWAEYFHFAENYPEMCA